MSMTGNLAFFQCIKMEVAGAPPEVLSDGPMPQSEASWILAREMLQSRHRAGANVEAVRFLTQNGDEICRYDLQQLLTEHLPPGDPLANGEEARGQGKPRTACPYLNGTKEWDDWLLGWDTSLSPVS